MVLLVTGLMDFFHALTYTGMNLVPGVTKDEPIQIWLAARLLQAGTFALAPSLLTRKPFTEKKRICLLSCLFALGILLSLLVYKTDLLPPCYTEGKGLTSFKVLTEYFIISLLAIGIARIWGKRHYLSMKIKAFLNAYIFLTILSELCFTIYLSFFDIEVVAGHIFKLTASFMLYTAVLEVGVRNPQDMLYRELADREKKLEDKTNELEEALKEKDILIREAAHRIKNNFSNIITLLNIKTEEETDSKLKESYHDIVGRLKSMGVVHDKLYVTQDRRSVDFSEYALGVCGELIDAYRKNFTGLKVQYELKPALVPVDTAVILGMILAELVTNTFKHAFPPSFTGEKTMKVRFTHANGAYNLEVQDNGVGLKRSIPHDSPGLLGHKLMPELAHQIGAEFISRTGPGASFTIIIPPDGIRDLPENDGNTKKSE